MISLKCILKFSDGAIATAEMQASSPDANYPIEWKGKVQRIPSIMRYEETEPDVLKAHCRLLADELGAKYEEFFDGEFECWDI